jgi:hypothetical protein
MCPAFIMGICCGSGEGAPGEKKLTCLGYPLAAKMGAIPHSLEDMKITNPG